jgi:pimeloyl-[acyl-carrier protein] methyl ester esterase
MLYSQTIGTGTSLVLLHGWGFNSELFNELIAKNQHKYRITTIDLPGHGKSADVVGGLDEWCNEIIKILPDNPILLGWSLGGLLAINIATKIKISKLILVASTPNFVKNSSWKYGIDANNFTQFANTLNLNLSKGLKRFVSLQTQNKNQLKKLYQSIDALPATTTALNQGLDILLNTNLTKQLLELKIDKKVILGSKDTLIPSNIQTWYNRHNIKSLMLNTGHIPFLDTGFKL